MNISNDVDVSSGKKTLLCDFDTDMDEMATFIPMRVFVLTKLTMHIAQQLRVCSGDRQT